jgi:hypothetical protein
VLTLLVELLIPYLVSKLEKVIIYFTKILNRIKFDLQMKKEMDSEIDKFFYKIFPYVFASYGFTNFAYAFKYLLVKEFQYFSPAMHLLK